MNYSSYAMFDGNDVILKYFESSETLNKMTVS